MSTCQLPAGSPPLTSPATACYCLPTLQIFPNCPEAYQIAQESYNHMKVCCVGRGLRVCPGEGMLCGPGGSGCAQVKACCVGWGAQSWVQMEAYILRLGGWGSWSVAMAVRCRTLLNLWLEELTVLYPDALQPVLCPNALQPVCPMPDELQPVLCPCYATASDLCATACCHITLQPMNYVLQPVLHATAYDPLSHWPVYPMYTLV